MVCFYALSQPSPYFTPSGFMPAIILTKAFDPSILMLQHYSPRLSSWKAKEQHQLSQWRIWMWLTSFLKNRFVLCPDVGNDSSNSWLLRFLSTVSAEVLPIKFFEVTSNNSSRNTVKYILKPADIILDCTECAFQTILMLKSSFATVILHVSSCKYNVTTAYVLWRIWYLRIRSRPYVSVQHA